MPKRSSTLQHSKVVERQVVRYLWGPDAARAWKEQHDLAGTDLNGQQWIGEVKDYSHETIRGAGGILRVALTALEQAEATPAGQGARCFGWVHTKRRSLDEDCVAFRQCGVTYYCTGATFAQRFVRIGAVA